MNKPRDIRFSFDNVDVAGRFVDAVFAIPNMGGVTIRLEDAPQETEEEPETADNTQSTAIAQICAEMKAVLDAAQLYGLAKEFYNLIEAWERKLRTL